MRLPALLALATALAADSGRVAPGSVVPVAPPAGLVVIGEDGAEIGNSALARRLRFTPSLHTVGFDNRLSGSEYPVESEEFALVVEGIARPLTARDFALAGPPVHERRAGEEALLVRLRHAGSGIEVEVAYRIAAGSFWIEKTLSVRAGARRIDDVDVERLRFLEVEPSDERERRPGRAPLGRPLFVAGELFLGLAYPAGHNLVLEDGTVALRHHPGRAGNVTSKTAVLGVAPGRVNERVRDWFLRYIDRVRARPLGRFTVWDTYHNDDEWAVRERFAVAHDCFAARGARIDAALMDGGFTDPKSVMRVHPERPERPALVRRLAREQLGAGLGMHVITSGARMSVDHAWLRQSFDMLAPSAYCLADPRAAAELERSLLGYIAEHDVRAFKFDWANFDCRESGHRGHRPGVDYGREAIVDAYLGLLDRLRAAKPDVFLYDAGWLSPWWLLHADAIFSGVGDYNGTMSGPPSLSENDLQTTWRDAILWKNLRDQDPAFPLSSLMNHGPINWGWMIWAHAPANPPDRFTDTLLVEYLRGPQLVEYYLNLAAVGGEARDAMASVMNWAQRNDDLLLAEGRFVLGDPRRDEVYGYAHFAGDGRGLVGIRNPALRPVRFELSFDEAMGMREDAGACRVSVVHPYLYSLPEPVEFGGEAELEVGPYEVLVVSVLPAAAVPQPLPLGVRYEVAASTPDAVHYRLLGVPAGEEVRFSDGSHRRVSYPKEAARILARPSLVARPADLRIPDPQRLDVTLELEVPDGVRARLVALQRVEDVPAQNGVELRLLAGGRDLKATLTYNAARDPAGEKGPGWVLADALTSRSGPVECQVRASADAARAELAEALPIECGTLCDFLPGKRLPFELWLLAEEPLAASQPIEVARTPGGRDLPLGLPATWQRLRRSARLLASAEQGVAVAGAPRRIYRVAAGATIYDDRDYRIRTVPKELEGLYSLRFSHARAKQDASLRFRARGPVRVHAAFGAVSESDQWLDPQPGWTIAFPGAFSCDAEEAGGDVYARDFPRGDVELFAGERGNWVLLGIAALPAK